VLFTLTDLASYLPETAENIPRATLLQSLTVGLIYETIPQDVADASIQAQAIGLEVAARAYRNADGYAQERVDDYSYQRPADTQAAGVYLTEDERATLLAIAAGQTVRKRVRSVRLASWSVPQL
jgi:pyruvoyl-dependent arginine decarboxylase (PvlArgDC)